MIGTSLETKMMLLLLSDEWKNLRLMVLQKHQVVSWRCYGRCFGSTVINKDMALITDTKSMEIPKEDKADHSISRYCFRRSETRNYWTVWDLHKSIIKICSRNWAIYPFFQHVIYTLYSSPDSAEEVIDFISKHDEIEAVTISFADPSPNPDFIKCSSYDLENVFYSYYPYLWWFN